MNQYFYNYLMATVLLCGTAGVNILTAMEKPASQPLLFDEQNLLLVRDEAVLLAGYARAYEDAITEDERRNSFVGFDTAASKLKGATKALNWHQLTPKFNSAFYTGMDTNKPPKEVVLERFKAIRDALALVYHEEDLGVVMDNRYNQRIPDPLTKRMWNATGTFFGNLVPLQDIAKNAASAVADQTVKITNKVVVPLYREAANYTLSHFVKNNAEAIAPQDQNPNNSVPQNLNDSAPTITIVDQNALNSIAPSVDNAEKLKLYRFCIPYIENVIQQFNLFIEGKKDCYKLADLINRELVPNGPFAQIIKLVKEGNRFTEYKNLYAPKDKPAFKQVLEECRKCATVNNITILRSMVKDFSLFLFKIQKSYENMINQITDQQNGKLAVTDMNASIAEAQVSDVQLNEEFLKIFPAFAKVESAAGLKLDKKSYDNGAQDNGSQTTTPADKIKVALEALKLKDSLQFSDLVGVHKLVRSAEKCPYDDTQDFTVHKAIQDIVQTDRKQNLNTQSLGVKENYFAALMLFAFETKDYQEDLRVILKDFFAADMPFSILTGWLNDAIQQVQKAKLEAPKLKTTEEKPTSNKHVGSSDTSGGKNSTSGTSVSSSNQTANKKQKNDSIVTEDAARIAEEKLVMIREMLVRKIKIKLKQLEKKDPLDFSDLRELLGYTLAEGSDHEYQSVLNFELNSKAFKKALSLVDNQPIEEKGAFFQALINLSLVDKAHNAEVNKILVDVVQKYTDLPEATNFLQTALQPKKPRAWYTKPYVKFAGLASLLLVAAAYLYRAGYYTSPLIDQGVSKAYAMLGTLSQPYCGAPCA